MRYRGPSEYAFRTPPVTNGRGFCYPGHCSRDLPNRGKRVSFEGVDFAATPVFSVANLHRLRKPQLFVVIPTIQCAEADTKLPRKYRVRNKDAFDAFIQPARRFFYSYHDLPYAV